MQRNTFARSIADEKRNYIEHARQEQTLKRARNVELVTNKQQAAQETARKKARIIAQAQANLRQTNQNLAKNVANLTVEHAHNVQKLAAEAKIQAQRNVADIRNAVAAAKIQANLQQRNAATEFRTTAQRHQIDRAKTQMFNRMVVQGHMVNARQLYGASKIAQGASVRAAAQAGYGRQLQQRILQDFLKLPRVKRFFKGDAGTRKFVKFTNPKKKIGKSYRALPPWSKSMFVTMQGVKKKRGFKF
jgi:hypothetical protein